MASGKDFKANFNFNMDSFKDLPGPTVEEIDEDDLDWAQIILVHKQNLNSN